MRGFTITLPSNVLGPTPSIKNIPANYTTKLAQPLDLEGDWEVAATRFQYRNEWLPIIHPATLGVFMRIFGADENTELDTSDPINAEMYKWMDEDWASAEGVYRGHTIYKQVSVPPGYYPSPFSLGVALEKAIAQAFKGLIPEPGTWLRHDADRKLIRLDVARTPDRVCALRIVSLPTHPLAPGDPIMQMIGFKPSHTGDGYLFYGSKALMTRIERHGGRLSPTAEQELMLSVRTREPEVHPFPEVQMLYLYSDIAGYSNVGGGKAQLLDTVVVTAQQGQYEDGLRSTRPNYVPLYQNKISSIQIQITDHSGTPLRIDNPYASMTVVLHFRKVKHGG
jgi:hypothetical protein